MQPYYYSRLALFLSFNNLNLDLSIGKSETSEQREKASRNQGKLTNAEEVYQECRDKWCEESDEILLPAKSDFLKMALRVVQFQQTLYKATAKKGEALSPVIQAMQETLEAGDASWADVDYAAHRANVEAEGGDHAEVRAKKIQEDLKNGGRRRNSSRGGNRYSDDEESEEMVSFNRKAKQVEKEMKHMDEEQFNGALDRLEGRIDDAPRADKKAMTARIEKLEAAYKKQSKKDSGSRSRGGSTASNGGGMDISHIPPEHLATLRGDPSLAAEFDRIYGPGASKAILKGHGGGDGGDTKRKKPKPEHVDMLLNNPSLVAKFDQIYGPGSGDELLRRTGHGQEDKPAVDPRIPPEHVQKLKDNPHLSSEFDRIYGPGTADSILGTEGGGEDEVLTLTLDPSQAPQAPDLPVINGIEVKQSHVDMLTKNPELGSKFDQFYGPGAAQQVLAQLSGGAGAPTGEDDILNMLGNTMNEGASKQEARERAVSDARDDYKSKRAQAAAVKPKKQPSEKHVQMLRENPSFAAKFDAVYGEGVADSILNNDIMESDTYREGAMPQMFPDNSGGRPSTISPLNLGKLGEASGGGDDAEQSNSPRTLKWVKENETRAAMGLKPKPHPAKK